MDVVVVARAEPFQYLAFYPEIGVSIAVWQFINSEQSFIIVCVFASQHSRILSLSIYLKKAEAELLREKVVLWARVFVPVLKGK